MLATLRQRNFALLWLGGLISTTGDWVLNVGLPIYAYLLTRSVLGLLPLLFVRSADRVWIIHLVALLESLLVQFSTPAQNALLPALVGEARLVQANALEALTGNIARLVGPASGGLIAAVFALNGIVLADVLSFLLAALLIGRITIAVSPSLEIQIAQAAVEGKAVRHFWSEWIDGLRVIRAERTLSVLLAMYGIMMLGEGVMSVLFPVFVYRVLHGEALQIGQLMSAQAVGGLLGGFLLGWLGQRMMSRWSIGISSIAVGVGDLLIFNSPAFFPFYWLSVGLFIAVGIITIFRTGREALLQAKSPDAYRGRIFGALGVVTGLLYLIGTIFAGLLTDHLGVVPVLNMQAAGYVLAGLLALMLLPREKKPVSSQLPDAAPRS